MPRNERTSKSVASRAAKALKDPKATKREKSLAGSALTQKVKPKKRTATGFEALVAQAILLLRRIQRSATKARTKRKS